MSASALGSYLTSPRILSWGYLLIFLSCAGLLAAAYYFEYVLYLDPCPLCMVQRLATALIGVFFLLAFFVRNWSWLLRACLLLALGAGILGVWSADHHIWLQGLPKEEVPACGPSIDYLIETLPLTELLDVMLEGDGNCAETVWGFLGLSMPQWTLLWFAAYSLAAFYALLMTFVSAHWPDNNDSQS